MGSKDPIPPGSSPAGPLEQDFKQVLEEIQRTRGRVFAQVNTALIDLYWHVGKTISEKVQSAGWGKGVVASLAAYIARNDPNIRGFSDKNLCMKQFFETYQGQENLATLWREWSWSHNRLIIASGVVTTP
jgi:hypothetical protein